MGLAYYRGVVAGFRTVKNAFIIRGFGSLWVIFAFLFSGCATIDDPYHGLDSKSRYYRVKQGDTLLGISKRAGYDLRSIADWNKISAPFRIYDGQIIRLFPPAEAPPVQVAKKEAVEKPDKVVEERTGKAISLPIRPKPGPAKTESRPVKTKPVEKKPDKQIVKTRETPAVARVAKKSEPVKKNIKKTLKISWQWPLKGVIAKNYSQTGRKGLDIAGKFGESVRAAADGRIVYCGQGLIGYGNLVIVKHDSHFLSAYGNNSRLLVQEGDIVKTGQRIAEVGIGKGKKAVLHFEIRKDGKPVDPIQHLPKP